MKILFLTTRNPNAQGDYLELTLVHGFRSLLGNNFVEFPKKKILYNDFSESPLEKLHGKGFSFCHSSILDDTNYDRSKLKVKDFDVIIHGSGHIYGDLWEVDHPNVFYTDGNDLYGNANRKIQFNGEYIIGTQYTHRCFKRELVEIFDKVWPIGFGVPIIKTFMSPNFENKKRKFQSTAPSDSIFYENSSYKFNNEKDYYQDMNDSWFGLTCKKGGWDCLRHYEIMASKSLLLFKDYDKKPPLCEPINFPTISYSTQEQLNLITERLVINNNPTQDYIELLEKQTQWFFEHGTTIARARQMLKQIEIELALK